MNFGELLQLKGQYQEKLEPPFVPGNEVSGIVKAVGAEVTSVKVGDAVVALPRGGGWARDVVVNETQVMGLGPSDDSLNFGQAASLAVTYGTAHMALVQRAQLLKGETVLVTAAAGGVGLAVVEVATYLGANVIAAASTKEKIDIAKSKGAKAAVLYEDNVNSRKFRDDVRCAAADFGGINVAVDMVGGHLLEPIVRSLNFQGRAIVVGFASGDIPKIPANILLVKNVGLLGLYWGSYARYQPQTFLSTASTVATAWRRGHFSPHIGSRYPLSNVNDAVSEIQNRLTSGKVVLDLDV